MFSQFLSVARALPQARDEVEVAWLAWLNVAVPEQEVDHNEIYVRLEGIWRTVTDPALFLLHEARIVGRAAKRHAPSHLAQGQALK